MRDFILGVAALTAFGFLVLWMISPSPYTPARSIDAEDNPPAPVTQPTAVAPITPSPPATAPAPVSTPIPTVSAEPPVAPPVAAAPAPSFNGAPPVATREFDALPTPAFATTPASKKARRQVSVVAPASRTIARGERSKSARGPSRPVVAKPVVARPVPKPAPAHAVRSEKKVVRH